MEGHPHILLVEDDPNLGYILSEYLGMKDFTVTWVKDGKQALDKTKTHPFSLCILDVMLPQMDGFTLAERITASGNTVPFIFLTAKQLKVDKLKAFTLGADDYLTKPVDEEELVARIRAVLKRAAAKPEQPQDEQVTIGNSVFSHRRQLLLHNAKEYKLTSRESDMLQLLIRYKNTLLDRDTVLKKIWGTNDYFNRRSMDVLISRLRKQLIADDSLQIINVHGRGYMLQEMRS